MTLTDEFIDKLKTCMTDKQLKKEFKIIASEKPDDYFPTKELRNLGYMRKLCSCGTYFWTTHADREVCGDPACSGGFQVVVDNPSPIRLTYINVWKKIVEVLEPRGYKPIKRYPCVARWNPTTEFTIASISAFQPYVITGEVEPPAKKLIIPQFCLRFNDIENVGLTGSHCCGFVMIGQHTFVSPEEWNQGQLFMDMHDFINKGVGLSKEEITIHEDSWAGGGSFGCSLEFFSRGVELFNQVYTMFEQTPNGPRELKLKVLDMGLGQERVAWFSQGTPNMYEAIFPDVLKKLREITRITLDLDLYNRFSQYSAYLNMDEVEDMDEAWKRVAKELKIEVKELKKKIQPMTALYSIAEHARSLLFAINDGKLPSNVGGGYNLRVIFRRAISFIDQFNWEIDIADVCSWHAEELKALFPEVSEHLDEIREILEVEREKYYTTKKKARRILEKLLKKDKITTETLIKLYDSNGISPDMIKEAAEKYNVKIKIPDNFYSLVLERHEKTEQVHGTSKEKELDLEGIPETKSLYYYDYTKILNNAKVLKIIDNMVILDKTVAYPTSGGQLHDVGTIQGQKFTDVFKQGNYTIHVLDEKPKFKEGDVVSVEVDKDWRTQLAQHHTATHIVNAAARDVLGNHVNQTGAKKTLNSSHLDISHFKQISHKKLMTIERIANEIVDKNIKLNFNFIPRSEAEQKYGMTIYQGGAVPGKKIRIVEIPGIDVEACGGTHLNSTNEAGKIKIVNSKKIQDGIVRLKFTAGNATNEILYKYEKIINELEQILNVEPYLIYDRIRELNRETKQIKKKLSTSKINKINLDLDSYSYFNRDLEFNDDFFSSIIYRISKLLRVKEENIILKVKKLIDEWENYKENINQISPENINQLVNNAEPFRGHKIIFGSFKNLGNKDIQNISSNVLKIDDDYNTIFFNEVDNGTTVTGMLGPNTAKYGEFNMGDFVKGTVSHFRGSGGGRMDYGSGFVSDTVATKDEIQKYIRKRLHKEL
ncbi:MAG: alanine--tRNA ligase [Candidatus Hermodarchaeota archaeon]